jgi:hypothetical protein
VIVWKGCPNFTPGRTAPIDRIVIHWMATTIEGADAQFHNAPDSAHYGVAQDGRIWQWVREEDTAWHAGDWAFNSRSIGIEHEAGPNLPPFTDAGYAASAALVAGICSRRGISHDRTAIVGHQTIVPTQCPGTIDIDRIIAAAHGEVVSTLGGLDLASLSDADAQALIWRVEALLTGRATVAGGPTAGEANNMRLTSDDFQALIWRMEALIHNRDVVAGPTKGETNALKAAIAALQTAGVGAGGFTQADRENVSAIKTGVSSMAGVLNAFKAKFDLIFK